MIAVSQTHLAVTSPDGDVSVWSLATGELHLRIAAKMKQDDLLRSHSAPLMQFSEDGNWLVFYAHGVLNIVDVSPRKDGTGPATDA